MFKFPLASTPEVFHLIELFNEFNEESLALGANLRSIETLGIHLRPVHVLLSRFYPDLILILSNFYPDKIRIKFR